MGDLSRQLLISGLSHWGGTISHRLLFTLVGMGHTQITTGSWWKHWELPLWGVFCNVCLMEFPVLVECPPFHPDRQRSLPPSPSAIVKDAFAWSMRVNVCYAVLLSIKISKFIQFTAFPPISYTSSLLRSSRLMTDRLEILLSFPVSFSACIANDCPNPWLVYFHIAE